MIFSVEMEEEDWQKILILLKKSKQFTESLTETEQIREFINKINTAHDDTLNKKIYGI